jgi:WD40 repeat protein
METYKVENTLEGHTEVVNTVCFSPDGTKLASGAGEPSFKIWNMKTRSIEATLEGH